MTAHLNDSHLMLTLFIYEVRLHFGSLQHAIESVSVIQLNLSVNYLTPLERRPQNPSSQGGGYHSRGEKSENHCFKQNTKILCLPRVVNGIHYSSSKHCSLADSVQTVTAG